MKLAEAIRGTLEAALGDRDVLVCGQLVRFGTAGLTEGLHRSFPEQVITFPVSENLMNSSAMGLALAGKRPVMVHERMDFLLVGMDALVNHIPVWPKKCGVKLPIVFLTLVGKGRGQGPQHSKNFAHWFDGFEGWTVVEPQSPAEAAFRLKEAIFGDRPVIYIAHREHLKTTGRFRVARTGEVRLCGASERHEREFYR